MNHKDIISLVDERVNMCDYKATEWREVFFLTLYFALSLEATML